jgi:hypothetical protein
MKDQRNVGAILEMAKELSSILGLEEITRFDEFFHERIYMAMMAKLFPYLHYDIYRIDEQQIETAQKIAQLIKLIENDILHQSLSHISGKRIS